MIETPSGTIEDSTLGLLSDCGIRGCYDGSRYLGQLHPFSVYIIYPNTDSVGKTAVYELCQAA